MSRRINELETKLHQAALTDPKHELSSKQAEALIPETKARQNALNFLLGVGLFKSLKDAKGNVIFRAVTKGELEQVKDLTGEESLVLGHIKAATNEGIWTKHLKAKTNLHQTIIDRCLKTLTQKKLIKRVPSVQHPTRKIYMLEGIAPSVGLTGGPWYTESELDTVFIETITKACLKFIRDVPRKEVKDGALFPMSNAPRYPTAAQARLTETELSVEHVEMLLEVLVLDGEVEKLPAFAGSLWDSGVADDGDSGDEDDGESRKKRKRRRSLSSDVEAQTKTKRKKKRVDTDSDDEDDLTARKKAKLKRKKAGDSDSDSDSGSENPKKRKRKKNKKIDSDESDSPDTSSRKKKKKKKKTGSDEESSEDEKASRKKKKKSTVKEESSSDDDRLRQKKRSPSPFQLQDQFFGGVVYRAVNQDRLNLGWTEAPCSKCPSFDFCRDGRPVNPHECVYYGDWLVAGTIVLDQES
ncbi:RNA polymerase Rpc34 subunit-domain-containing protein [Mycena pura]|uniref:RNA polymerase Rpc34 subunit-domain-containing protein n=1 Tax=Mycena pura TaxID=153505 RepID=A0AAD6YTH1_9AGAR|nr:RNA polymerase Rpc34 subunit-domain-containing protein [Mycena pura]